MRLVCGDELRDYLPEIAALIKEKLPTLTGIERMQAIAVVSGTVKAVVLYSDYSPADVQMHVASYSPNWCKRGVLRGLFHYPFEQLRVRRVTAMISKKNKHTRRFVERLGFRLEGVHPEALPDGTAITSYGMLRKDCRWIDG